MGKKKAPPPRAASSGDEDDISLMSDSSMGSVEEQRAALHRSLELAKSPDLLEHRELWAEVDNEELERIAITIARNAVPPAENAEAAARINSAAAALESDSADPLGLGRIDTRVLTLTRDQGRASLRFGRGSILETARRGGREGGDAPEAGPAQRALVLPTSEQFDPELYLGTIHSGTTLQDLLRGLQNLRGQLSEHTGQLKSLVKENFDRFISSKNTIDDIYAKLQKAEAEGGAGVNGTSTTEVMDAVLQVQDEARRAFGSLLDRQAKAERIRLVLGVMRRYEAIVRLPARVREHAEQGDHKQVVADYRRAKALLADQRQGGRAQQAQQAQQPPQQQDSMWLKLMEEIDKVVSSVAYTLETAVRSADSSSGEAADAIEHLLQLRAEGVRVAQEIDPASLYVESQERHILEVLRATVQQHASRLESLQRQYRQSEEYEAQVAAFAAMGIAPPSASSAASLALKTASPGGGGRPLSPGGAAPSSAGLAAALEGEAVGHLSRLTGALAAWIPEFWQLTQQRLPALGAISGALPAVERGVAAAERAVVAVLGAYRQAVQAVLAPVPLPHTQPRQQQQQHQGEAAGAGPAGLAAAGLGHTGLLCALRELVAGWLEVREEGGPPAALEVLQALAEQAAERSMAAAAVHLSAAVGRACEAEDYALLVSSQRAGAPCTATVERLKQLLLEGMQHLSALLSEAAHIGFSPLSKSAAPARALFFGCFEAFAGEVERLGAAMPPTPTAGDRPHHTHHHNEAGARREGCLPPSCRLLVLSANLVAARSALLPQLLARWGALLQAGGPARNLQAAAQQCSGALEAAETRLMVVYIESKQAQLDDLMDEYFFGDGTAWGVAPSPSGLRPVVLDLLHLLVAVQAELAAVVPGVLQDALEELLAGTFDGFAQVVSSPASLPLLSPGGALQLSLEGRCLRAAVGALQGEPMRQASGRLGAALEARLAAALRGADAQQQAQLSAWAAGVAPDGGGGSSGGGHQQQQQQQQQELVGLDGCQARLGVLQREAMAAACANLLPLQLLGRAQRG